MNQNVLSDLERAVETFVAREPQITPQRIRELIADFRFMPKFTVTDEQAEALARSIEQRHDVTMSLGSALTAKEFKPWLDASKADIDFYYWTRYKRLLEDKQLSGKVLAAVDEDTDRTLGFLQNPATDGPWQRRGMVVGHVQSGKTANYIGLVSKAADAGYKLIIVIAGIHNNLRNQTQKRIDEGFVGRDSARMLSKQPDRLLGVGKIDPRRRPITFTNSVRDFSKQTATGVGVPLKNLNEPAVFVIKKNSSTLKNLVEWLEEHNAASGRAIDLPMLLIDDEADNASINTGFDRNEVTKINGQIRKLLLMFNRSCYVGYTATPFANIFIDPDTDDQMLGADLFPKDFIVSLDPPSNYFGPDRVFRESPSVVRHISDNETLLPVKHTKAHVLGSLPESLQTAVRAFVLVRAIRLVRGQTTEHNSMLVNASRFTAVQGTIKRAISDFLGDVQASVRLHCMLSESRALRDPEMAELYELWREEYSSSHGSWADIQRKLNDAAAPIRVTEVNSLSHGTLNYDDHKETGLNVIAVGGYALSRGLTLEGLTISYFLRNSMMYDTLMQMGRWFGYRPGYDDLCRVWMPEEAENWYEHIAESVEMLRDEFRRMAAAGATPEEFGLKVRAHPDTLIVTARNKMGAGEKVVVNIGLAREFVETSILRADADTLRTNRQAAARLASDLEASGRPVASAECENGGNRLLTDVPVTVIKSFLARFKSHPAALLADPGPIARYIEERQQGELARWDVVVTALQKPSGEDPLIDETFGVPIVCQMRSAGDKTSPSTLYITNKQRVASRGLERIGLPADVIEKAEKAYRQLNPQSRNYPDRIYRQEREKAVLFVHMLQIKDKNDEFWKEPVVAWSISFPETQIPQKRAAYVVSAVWMRENMVADLDEPDEDENGDV